MENKIKIIHCDSEHIDEMVAFITRMNNDPQHHIAYFGVGEADIRASLAENFLPVHESFFLAYENNRLAGMFGLDINSEIGRAWLLGPIVDHASWNEIADELFSAVQAIIPQGIREQEFYFDVENKNMRAFSKRHEFPPRAESAIYFLTRDAYRPPVFNDSMIIKFDEVYFSQFESLHDNLFPNTYYTAKQIVEKQDEHRRLLIAVENEKLTGYNFCKIEDRFGYIDFIGVDESARRRGIASALLASGINWMLAEPSISRINLTMNIGKIPAQSLYEKFGFKCERITCGYRKTVSNV